MERLVLLTILMVTGLMPPTVFCAETVTTVWGGDVLKAYDTGFAHHVMRHPCGVSLFNIELIENDAPGAGKSEKGASSDFIWGDMRGRKVFNLDNPRAQKAWIAIFVNNGFTNTDTPKYPLRFSVNGNESAIELWDFKKVIECYRWVEFPASWLKKGRNEIDLYCPEAKSQNEGWELYISRADEFGDGGGDSTGVGETSFKSFNGGKSWQKSPFGPDKNVRAEYTVRLSLDRCLASGSLETPVIDVWKGESEEQIVPLREIQRLSLRFRGDVPDGTKLEYFIRKGTEPGPFSLTWEPYEPVGSGGDVTVDIDGARINRRYIQIRVALSTSNPLASPVVRTMEVRTDLVQRVPTLRNVRVIEADNRPIAYSSIDWEWESWDRPEFEEIRKRENLDEVIAGSRNEFNAQVKILDHVAKRWRWALLSTDYPSWAAKSILDRIDTHGLGGFCVHFNNTIGGLCMVYGWQARIVNIVAHEVIEVWNDDYGKWVMLDGAFDPDNGDTYQYDPVSAEPLNMLELHRRYIDYYFPDRPIDWMRDFTGYQTIRENDPPPVARGTLTPERPGKHTGFITAAFMRMIPRNNWYEKPTPKPLNHGTSWWPWDGYVNWYDDRTPPKRQYSQHTDRPRDLWPDLNRVYVHVNSGFGNDRLFLRFETCTPNFSRFEVNVENLIGFQ